MILLIAGEVLATIAMSKYLRLQRQVENFQSGASYFNNNIVGVAAFTIFANVFAAIVFGTMFFFLLFFPASPETMMWSRIKCATSLFVAISVTAAIVSSTIVGASSHGHLIPSTTGSFQKLQNHFANPSPPFKYRKYSLVIGWLVLSWVGWVFAIISTFYVFKASRFHLANPYVVNSCPNVIQQTEAAATLKVA